MRKNKFLNLILLMLIVDTVLLYALPYLSSVIELNHIIQSILVIVLFPVILLFPISIDKTIGKDGIKVFIINNLIILFYSGIFFVANGSIAQELNAQKRSVGGAVVVEANKSVALSNFANNPFIELQDVKFSKKGIYLANISNGARVSDEGYTKIKTYCLKLLSHKDIELCIECSISPILNYNDKAYCKKKQKKLKSFIGKKKINALVITSIKLGSKTIEAKPIDENFETYLKDKNSKYNTYAPLGYFSIPIAIIVTIFL